LEAVWRKPRTSKPAAGHKVHPHPLRDLAVERPKQVPLSPTMDWFSRCAPSRRLSTSLRADCCADALEEALDCCGKPEIFNADQGAPFASEAFAAALLDAEIGVSMDGEGRRMDDVLVERLRRSLKCEEVYPRADAAAADARAGVGSWIGSCNLSRPRQALGHRAPAGIFAGAAGPGDMMGNADALTTHPKPTTAAGFHLS
jgi:putative transposase